MTTTWNEALLAVMLLCFLATAVGRLSTHRASRAATGHRNRGLKAAMRRILLAPVSLALVIAVTACDRSGGSSPKTIRKLASSDKAVRARQQAEAEIRSIIAAWEEHTPLALGLTTLNDVCAGGKAKEWFFPTGDDQYKIRCAIYVTVYFGADPHHIADTIDGILAAGDHDRSKIPFGHDFDYANRIVDYYRGKSGDPQGAGTGEPHELFEAATLTLKWDQVRTGQNVRKLIEEPRPCGKSDLPVRRCLYEPRSTSVADIRRKHGMVFELTFPTRDYFVVPK